MKNELILTTCLWVFTVFGLHGQIKLDVEGNARIEGNLKLNLRGNISIGEDAGLNTSGLRNIFIGDNTGTSNASGEENVFVGYNCGLANTSGSNNIIFGYAAGNSNKTGNNNLFFGKFSGFRNTGSSNIFLGSSAGSNSSSGNNNVFLGISAGNANISGSRNTFLGTLAGSVSGQGALEKAITIGYKSFVNCSNCAVIGGTGNDAVKTGIGTTTPLSDFHIKQSDKDTTRGIRLEYSANENSWSTYIDEYNDYNFAYNDSLKSYIQDADGAYTISSDGRLKKNISRFDKVLDKVIRLKPAQYYYKSARNPIRKSWGFIAQEVEKIFPEIVVEKNGYKALVYDDFAILSIKAIQELAEIQQADKKEVSEQKAKIEDLQTQITDQQTQITELTTLVEQLLAQNTIEPQKASYLLSLEQKAQLAQNQPNPFRENTLVNYFIPANIQRAHIQVTDVNGTILGKVNLTEKGPGQVTINPKSYPAGTYFYSLVLDGQVMETKRMVLTR